MAERVWWMWGAVATVLVAAYFAVEGVAGEAFYIAVPLLAAAVLLWSAQRMGWRSRGLPWVLLALGQVSSAVGDALWVVYEHQGLEPFPSLADAFYLGSYPLYALGLLLLIRRRTREGGQGSFIDAAILMTGTGLAAWVYLMAPLVAEGSSSTLATWISLGYPAADVLLIGLAARLFLTAGGRTPALRLLVCGIAAMLSADLVYAWLEMTSGYEGGLVDLGWLASYVLYGMAGAHRSAVELSGGSAEPERPPSLHRLVLLTFATLVAPLMLFARSSRNLYDEHAVISVGAVMLFGLVMVRMGGLVRQVQRQAALLDVLSRTDPLTGALNRRALEDELAAEMHRAGRAAGPLTLALIDLDHFKAYNDGHGHQAGDVMLRHAVAAWGEQLRPTDLLARYGGEEFVVVLPACGVAGAVEVLERLRDVTPDGQTCSIGVAAWDGLESADSLLSRADTALYQAKADGRDRVVVADRDRLEPAQTAGTSS